MTSTLATATPLERRITRRLEARGDVGLGEALLRLKGVLFGPGYRFESLYAVGGEGAVYLVRDTRDRNSPVFVAKVPLLPLHRPFQLDSNEIRKRRYGLRVEAQYLAASRSKYLPEDLGTFEFQNPLLDAARGDAFVELEPVMVMEKMPGRDLDVWLARMHRSDMPQDVMRRTLDRVAVVTLQALVDLWDRGFIYADLRPGNLRMMGRPERRIRLLDAGSLVAVQDKSGRYPHVPAYLPPETFAAVCREDKIVPSGESQAIMAGRTLFEAATGRVPLPGQDIDRDVLADCNVSQPIAEVIDGLCNGDFDHVRTALRFLIKRAKRRVVGANDPTKVTQNADDAITTDKAPTYKRPKKLTEKRLSAAAARANPAPKHTPQQRTPVTSFNSYQGAAEPAHRSDEVLPPSQPVQKKKGFFARLLALFTGK